MLINADKSEGGDRRGGLPGGDPAGRLWAARGQGPRTQGRTQEEDGIARLLAEKEFTAATHRREAPAGRQKTETSKERREKPRAILF